MGLQERDVPQKQLLGIESNPSDILWESRDLSVDFRHVKGKVWLTFSIKAGLNWPWHGSEFYQ